MENNTKPTWIDFPTETGWWWSKDDGEKPCICYITNKDTQIVAMFPNSYKKRYLDRVLPHIKYQKVLPPID